MRTYFFDSAEKILFQILFTELKPIFIDIISPIPCEISFWVANMRPGNRQWHGVNKLGQLSRFCCHMIPKKESCPLFQLHCWPFNGLKSIPSARTGNCKCTQASQMFDFLAINCSTPMGFVYASGFYSHLCKKNVHQMSLNAYCACLSMVTMKYGNFPITEPNFGDFWIPQ